MGKVRFTAFLSPWGVSHGTWAVCCLWYIVRRPHVFLFRDEKDPVERNVINLANSQVIYDPDAVGPQASIFTWVCYKKALDECHTFVDILIIINMLTFSTWNRIVTKERTYTLQPPQVKKLMLNILVWGIMELSSRYYRIRTSLTGFMQLAHYSLDKFGILLLLLNFFSPCANWE